MRHLLLSILLSFIGLWTYGQTIVFQEGFEGSTISMTSSSLLNNNAWGVSSMFHYSGQKCDTVTPATGDTTYLTSSAFNTTGNTFVMLEFAQICKVEFFDKGYIEVSVDSGATWTKVLGSHYLGSGAFAAQGNAFSSTSYVDWLPASNNAVPTSSWWKYESFDISSLVADTSNVMIRFAMADNNGSGPSGNYGWLIDDVKVTVALSELTPPTITYTQPMLQDSVFNYGPFTIQATISDASGIDTAMLIYQRTGVSGWDTVGMTGAGSTFIGTIDTVPTFSLHDTVRYYIYAVDASLSHNATRKPLTSDVQFIIYTSPPPPGCTSPLSNFPFIDNFDANSSVNASCGGTYTVTGWTNDGPTNDWAPHSGSTPSYQTGPTGDHTTGNGIYLYTETSCSSGSYTAILTSPCMDISSLSAPQLEFWYHMYGVAMGTLTVQVWSGGQYVDVWSKSGDQGNTWHKAIVNLIPYKGITKIRFKGVRGTSYTSDMSIDDVKIWVPPANDAGIVALNTPTTPALSGVLPVKVSMKNYGSANLTSATINWQINGVTQTPYYWTGNLPPMVTADSIQIGTYTFTAGAPSIKIWSSSPNGSADGFAYNDTLNTSVVVCDGFLHGSYTVGGAGADFSTIDNAVQALNNCGVDSAVVFNINSGTYTGQLTFGAITGVNDTNTVTFQSASGNASDVTIQYAASSLADNWVVRFDGSSYITLKNLTIKSSATGSYAAVVNFKGNAEHNNVISCNIEATSYTSSYNNCIRLESGSAVKYNRIEGNTMTGGYYSLYFYGQSTYICKGNQIVNNDISGFYYYGIYSYYQDSITIKGNYIHDNTNTYGYGMYTYRNKNGTRIIGNRVKLSPSSGAYGIYLYYMNYQSSTQDDTCLVYNNMISLTNTSSTTYGFYGYYASKTKVMFNTININAGSTSSRCFYQSGGSGGLIFKNNIFVNTGGGYTMYANTPTNILYSDYNDYYATGNYLAYWSGNVSSLSGLQSSSGKENHSVSADPQFVSPTDLHAGAVSVHASAIYDSLVMDDYDGDLRDSIPCMGADEFILVGDDAGVSAMTSPIFVCPGDTAIVKVEIKNYGTDTLYSATVNWAVNSTGQTSYSWSGTLLPGQKDTVTLGNYVFQSGVSYQLEFWTSSPNGISDLNTANDSLVVPSFKTSIPAGTYLLGHGTNADYHSLDSLMIDLNSYGICGPVVINIDTGTYNGRIVLNNVLGVNSVNTLTFKSVNGDSSTCIINYAASSSQPAAISLTDMSYVTVKGITFNLNSSSAGRGIALWGNSKHNVFESCVFNLPSGTSSSLAGVYFNVMSVGYNTFKNNKFYNGYYGAYARGTSSTSPGTGNVFEGNIFENFYYYGIYGYYQDSLIINHNTFTGLSTAAYPRGLYLYYCRNYQEVIGNTITLTPSSYAYGVYMYRATATSSNKGLFFNNMISIDGGTGTSYGFYCYNNAYHDIFYNTIRVNSAATGTRGLYISQGSNLNVKNNVISSNHYAYYVSTPYVISSSDYNNLYTTGTYLAYWSGNKATLTALQSASGKDQHSMSVYPNFISNSNLHFFSSPLDGMGIPIASVLDDIDGDVRDTLHPDMGADEFDPPAQDVSMLSVLSPDSSGCGMTNVSIMVQFKNNGTDTIQGNLVMKYSLDNGANVVSENMTGIIPPGDTVIYTFSTQANLTATVDTTFFLKVWGVLPQDPIALNDTAVSSIFNGVIPSSPVVSGVQTAYGTTATLTASSSNMIFWYDSLNAVVPLGIGSNFTTGVLFDTTIFYCGAQATNGCMSNKVEDTVYVTGIPAGDVGIAAINVNTGCNLDSTESVSIDIYNQGTGTVSTGLTAAFRVNNNSWTTPENVNLSIGPGATVQYTFTATANLYAPADTMFDITAAVTLSGDPYHANDTLLRDSVLSLYTPAMPTVVSPLNIAYGASATLTASSPDTLLWYYTDTSTVPFAGGSPQVVGPLYLTDTFYVIALAGASGSGAIGTGTNQNSTTSYPVPYGQWYTGNREQYLILASELQAAGIPAGNITSLAFDVVTPNSATSTGANHDNFTIKMKNVSMSSVSSTFQSGLTQVYTVPSYQTVTGWNVHEFDTPFNWDGSSNLLIEVCYDNYQGSGNYSNNAIVNRSNTSFLSTVNYHSDQGSVCTHTSGTTYTIRPNMMLEVHNTGCPSPKANVIVNVAPPPALDAAMYSVENPPASVQSNIPVPVTVKLKNYGTNTLTSTTISYELDGVVKANYAWTGSVAFGDTSSPVTVYTDTFSGGTHNMRFWVTGANGSTQAVNANDTISFTFSACMNGTYTIGDSTKDYQSFTQALNALNIAGICGHVTFLVDSGTYNEQLDIQALTGMDANNTVTFKSASGDSTDVVLQYTASGSTDNFVVHLNGCAWFGFENMTILGTGTSYGRAVVYDNEAEYNHFSHCVIRTSGTNNSNSSAIYSSSGADRFNTFSNNLIQNGYYTVYLRGGSGSNHELGTVFENNIIENFYYYGLYTYYVDSLILKGNIIRDGNSTYNYPRGLYLYYAGGAKEVVGNKIILNPVSYAYGMYMYRNISTAIQSGLIANNMVIINGGSSSSYGIYCYYTDYNKFYNNSMNIVGGSAGTRGLYVYQGSNNELINNSLAVNGQGYPLYVISPLSISSIDYNNYYTQGNYLAYWSGNKTSLSALQSATGQDSHSISSDPAYFAYDDLHTSNVDMNGAAYPLSEVAFDYDMEPRDSLHPDIGADEYTPPLWDAGIANIDSPVSPLTVGSNDVKVTVRNFGVDTLYNASIGWSVNGTLQTSYSYSDTLITGDTVMNVNIGSFTAVSGANTLKVWTSMPNGHNDQLNMNDTAQVTLIGCTGAMGGIYTVGGTSADFPDISSAANALNYCGVNDTVIFMINSGSYNERLELGQITGVSDTSFIVFRSAVGDSTAVSLNYSSGSDGVVYLNGADYIHFEDMTIEALGSSSGYAVKMENGANHNVFESCIIKAPVSTSSASRVISSAGGKDEYNIFKYNQLYGGYYAIYFRGQSSSSSGLETGNMFLHNDIGGFYYYGVYFYYEDSLQFKYNLVQNGSNANYGYAVYLYYCDNGMGLIGNKLVLTPNYYMRGIYMRYCDATANEPSHINNNFISIANGSSTNYGFYMYNCTHQHVAFNSINVSTAGSISYSMYLSSGSNNYLMNNIFMNTAGGYALYVSSGYSVANSDHNDIYTTSGSYAYWSGSKATLADLQLASGMDSNSVAIDPGFYSNTDLHITSPALALGGTPFDNVTTDIDGETRNATTPSIGADEFIPLQWDAAAYSIAQPTITYSAVSNTVTVEMVVRNFGMDTITSMTLGYMYAGNSPVTQNWTGSLPPGGSLNFTFTNGFTVVAGTNPLCVFTNLSTDMNHSNDTLCMAYTGMPLINLTYIENFDGPTSYWSSDGNVWQLGTPAQSNLNAAHSAPNAWMTKLSTNYPSSADANLYSPFFNVSNVSNATLKFWHKTKISSNDGGNVQYSTDGGQTWILLGYMGDPLATNWYTANIGGNHYFSGTSTSWTLSSYDVSSIIASATGPIQFRFHFMSNGSGENEGWLIDDFSLELPQIAFDGGVTDIINPDTSSIIGMPVTVKAVVTNLGYDTLYSIPMRYTVNGGTPVQETFTVSGGLLPGDTGHYTFNTTFTAPGNDYTLCAYTQIAGDAYSQNDSYCKNITVLAAPLDAGIIAIVEPKDTVSFYNSVRVIARIYNFGTSPLSTVDLSYQVNTATPVVETWSGTPLQQGDSVDYTFQTVYNSPINIHQLCVKTLLTGDMNSSNDETCKSVFADGLVEELANGMKLYQNIPNPAAHKTSIRYEIPSGGYVHFEMVNSLGESVVNWTEKRAAGVHDFDIDASKLGAGIYYYSIEFDGYRLTKQMVINR